MGEFLVAVLSLVSCVFATSATVKLRNRSAYRSFRIELRETGLVPERLLPAVAAALAGSEAVTAVGLATAAAAVAVPGPGAIPLIEATLAAAALLTAVLALGIAIVMRRGTRARCACFGAGSGRPLGRAHLVRNLALLAVLLGGLADNPLSHRPALAGAVVAAVAGGVTAQLFIRWDDLIELFAPYPGATPTLRRPGHGPR